MATTLLVTQGHISAITAAEDGLVRDGYIFNYSNEPSTQAVNHIPSGGAVIAGDSTQEHFGGIYWWEYVASGGGIFGGVSTFLGDNLNIDDFIGSGGVVIEGSALIDSLASHSFDGSGGAEFGGVAVKVGSYTAIQNTVMFTCT